MGRRRTRPERHESGERKKLTIQSEAGIPSGLDDLSRWHESLRNLVAKHGPLRVWNAGIESVGFPPTWITEVSLAAEVAAKLES